MSRSIYRFAVVCSIAICLFLTSFAFLPVTATNQSKPSSITKQQTETDLRQSVSFKTNSAFNSLFKTEAVSKILSGNFLRPNSRSYNANKSLIFGGGAPSITPSGTLTRQQGSGASNSEIAMVSDTEDAAGDLVVTATNVPAGITISNISNSNGTVTADIKAECNAATGDNIVELTVTDTSMATATANLTVNVTANDPPTLTYPASQNVAYNGSATVNPTMANDNGTIMSYEVLAGHGLNVSPTVDSSGVVSITNAAPAGSHTITIRATDDCGGFTDSSFTLNVDCPTITVNPASISNATYGMSYNETFTAMGGSGSYSFSITAGALPNGLMLGSNGNLSGTPTEVGTFNFTVTATDINGVSRGRTKEGAVSCFGSQSYTLEVIKAETTTTITNEAILNSTPTNIGQSYTVQWNVTSLSTGTITGTVLVSDGTDSCNAPVADGQCTLTSLTEGTKTITADYSGDTNFNASSAPGVSHDVLFVCTTDPVVTNSDDDGVGSLRFSIYSACDDSTITFDNSVTNPIVLAGGELLIDKNLTIQGPGADKLTLTPDKFREGFSSRIFFIGSEEFRTKEGQCHQTLSQRKQGKEGGFTPVVTISGLTIADGLSFDCDGGGIHNLGTLTLRDSLVNNNLAVFYGGGIYNGGDMTIINSAITNNDAFESGGGIFNDVDSTLKVINSTISNNVSEGSDGGGITNDGTMTLTNSTITGNAHAFSGGVRPARKPEGIVFGGGGISTFGFDTLNNTIVADNCQLSFMPSFKRESFEQFAPCSGALPEGITVLPNDIMGDVIVCEGCAVEGGGSLIEVANSNLIGDANTSGGILHGVNNNIVGNSGVGTIDINTVLDTKLEIYGGTTPSHHLIPKSPAIDAGDDSLALDENDNPLVTDQRGATYPRIRNSNYDAVDQVDIGAFEQARKVPVDFDGDGRSDYAVVTPDSRDITNKEPTGNRVGEDILSDSRQRYWTHDYQKLLMLRSGRGFAELPKDVQEALSIWKQEGSLIEKPAKEGLPLMWVINRSGNGETVTEFFGTSSDVLVPADYDGDGECDVAIWTPISVTASGVATNQFVVIRSSDGNLVTYDLGISTSDPTVVGDYDGDGRDDPAVFDKSTGLWSYLGGADHDQLMTQIWMPNGVPAPGDYNGDGKYDFAVQLPPLALPDSGKFRVAFNDGSITSVDVSVTYGLAVFAIVPADYDGDGVTDLAQGNLTGSSIIWRVATSSTNFTGQVKTTFGTVSTDRTVQGDYDGDGKIDRAIFRATDTPDDGVFRVRKSSDGGIIVFDLGGQFDNPVAFFNTH